VGNSTYTIQDVFDEAMSNGDTAPGLATGGFSDQPALNICNTILRAMVSGGPNGQPFNFKWNRFNISPFFAVSWQQDYFVPGLVQLERLESCWAIQFTNASQPKIKIPIEIRKDLQVTNWQTGGPCKMCWIPAKLAQVGTWGDTELQTPTGQNNPGPNVVYTDPSTSVTTPANPITQIKDPNGNFWVVTGYGTCGAVQPTWPTSPVYPTFQIPTTTATTQLDGSVIWTAINPDGQALRVNPIPPKQGVVWEFNPVGQLRPPKFTSLTQPLDPIPDEFYPFFRDGFFAECYRRHPDPKVRARFPQEYQLWQKSLDLCVKQADSEQDDYGFVPSNGCMETGLAGMYLGPAWPYSGVPFGSY